MGLHHVEEATRALVALDHQGHPNVLIGEGVQSGNDGSELGAADVKAIDRPRLKVNRIGVAADPVDGMGVANVVEQVAGRRKPLVGWNQRTFIAFEGQPSPLGAVLEVASRGVHIVGEPAKGLQVGHRGQWRLGRHQGRKPVLDGREADALFELFVHPTPEGDTPILLAHHSTELAV